MAQQTTKYDCWNSITSRSAGRTWTRCARRFTDVGLTPDFGGPHGNGVTQMAAIGFDDGTYIELIAPVKAGVTTGSEWAKFMGEDAVTCAWAVGTNVLLQEVDRLKKAGIAVTAPERGSRKRPDGMSVEWKTADVGTGTRGSVLPFIIEDETPRAWRVQTSASVQGAPVIGRGECRCRRDQSRCCGCAVSQGIRLG